ncbi:hypothetical protein [Streptomyces tauricus]|nr:hypothetical protein [Streptomyces tauricus]MCW8102683.1 hypothetical protein [Streptomyces tauricus]
MRKAALGLFIALTAVLAIAPLANTNADHTQTVACCGGTPGFP